MLKDGVIKKRYPCAQNNARTFTCMELRQSSSSSTKGSSISRAEASDDVTLAFLRLRWSS